MSEHPTQYWLFKAEADVFGIDDLQRADHRTTCWDGVRNYQVRNYIRDAMKVGDGVLYYHSNAEPTGIAGLARIVREAYPDHTQFEPDHPHFDPKSSPGNPRWFMVDIAFVERFPALITLADLRANPALAGMMVLRRGNRLSITPVTADEWNAVLQMSRKK